MEKDNLELPENKESIPFQQLLDAVLDESTPLPAKFLFRLSDLAGDELTEFTSNWQNISDQRRVRLMEDLEQLEESNTIVSFESICHIALKDEDADVRLMAIRTLWGYEDPSLIPVLLNLLSTDPAIKVRAQAAAGLGRFIFLGELEQISSDKVKPVEEKLLEIMHADEPEPIRLRALESLGYSGRETAHDLIEESFAEGDENWVSSALYAMGRSADEQWAPNILDKLDDMHPKIRLEAVRAAGELKLEEAVSALIYLLEGEDSEIMFAAAWALSEIGGEDVRETLEDLVSNLDDDDDIDLIQDALENLELTEEIEGFAIFDIPEEDLEKLEDDYSEEDI